MTNILPSAPHPSTPDPQPFDIIGDVHGHASELHALLLKLGYAEHSGTYRHPDQRQVIFLGDWIDRGPAIRETLRVVRAMHAAGTALAVPGNHEFNSLAYATLDECGKPLRVHSKKNVEQHAETLAQFAAHMSEWQEHLEWFRSLPIWLELPGLRAVHAAWHDRSVAVLGPDARITERLLRLASTPKTPQFIAIEILLKGIEVPLPDGHFFHDNKNVARQEIRTRWWMPAQGNTFRGIALQPGTDDASIPNLSADAYADLVAGYGEQERPVFNGHYWLTGEPALMAPNVAILDYSIAKGGALTAYRWDGEPQLDAAKFVQVQAGEKTAGE